MAENIIQNLNFKESHFVVTNNLQNNYQKLYLAFVECQKDMGKIKNFLIELDAFNIFYNPYIEDSSTTLELHILELKKLIYSRTYDNLLFYIKKGRNLTEHKAELELYNKIIEKYEKLGQVLQIIPKSFVKNGVFPKISSYEDEKSSVVRSQNQKNR